MYSNRDSISFRYTLPLYSDVQLQVIRETIDILDSDCYTTVWNWDNEAIVSWRPLLQLEWIGKIQPIEL